MMGKVFLQMYPQIQGSFQQEKRIHRGALFADYDNDGKVDIYITVNGQQVEDGKGNNIFDENQGRGILFHNETSTKNNWLKVRLEGKTSNRDGFGAVVSVVSNDQEQKQALVSGQGYFSCNAQELYFGLKETNKVDRVNVSWPSGIKQSFQNVSHKTDYIHCRR